MTTHPTSTESHEEIISYQKLRTFIGITGIFLPVAMVTGSLIFGAKAYSWQISISHYYYSVMHIVFVGTLCVLGGFLITYKGKNHLESWVSNFTGYFAFGIAAFPTPFDGFRLNENGNNQYLAILKTVSLFWGNIHFAFAAALFGCFTIFCLIFFQKPDRHYDTPEEQLKFRRRKRIYKICGWGILFSMLMIALHFIFKNNNGIFAYTTFIFETAALWFFGTAWLIKGSVVLKKVPVVRKLIKSLR